MITDEQENEERSRAQKALTEWRRPKLNDFEFVFILSFDFCNDVKKTLSTWEVIYFIISYSSVFSLLLRVPEFIGTVMNLSLNILSQPRDRRYMVVLSHVVWVFHRCALESFYDLEWLEFHDRIRTGRSPGQHFGTEVLLSEPDFWQQFHRPCGVGSS